MQSFLGLNSVLLVILVLPLSTTPAQGFHCQTHQSTWGNSRQTFDDHVNSVSRSAFYHIWAMRHIRSALTEDMAKTVACAFVEARLDYANPCYLELYSFWHPQ